MTDHNIILDSRIDPDAPATSDLFYHLRDNPIAISEGSADAPRIRGEAAARENNGLLSMAVSAGNTATIQHGHGAVAGVDTTSSIVDVVGYTYTIASYTGSLRFKCTHGYVGGGGGSTTLSLYKNGVLVTTFSTTSSAIRQVDASISNGDVFQWRHRVTAVDNSVLSDISVTASNGYVEQPLYIPFGSI